VELPDLTQFGKRDYALKLCYLWLTAVGPVSSNRELAEVLGLDETTIGQRLKVLQDSGLIQKRAGGWAAR
jgi:predicted transcriptional regulator